MANHRVCVRRWRSTYLVPRAHSAPERVRDRLDTILSKQLPGALSAHLERALDQRSEALLFVRHLHLDFPVDAGWDAETIAAQCARALSWQLQRELAIDDPNNVIRFPNRAVYLARFVADRASGDAGNRWYYAQFSGLNALPCGAALRTALLQDSGLGLSALRSLPDGELADVIAAMGDIECRRIADAFAAAAPQGELAQAYAALLAVVHEPLPGGIVSPAQTALWHAARAASVDRSLLQAASTLARVLAALRSGSVRSAAALSTLADSDAGVFEVLARIDPAACAELHACPPALLRRLLAAALPREPEPEALGSTPFGGPFMLLDDLFALPLEPLTGGWPMLDSVPAATVLRFLILTHCCGATRVRAMFADATWRRLFGIAPTVDFTRVGAWLAALGPRCRRRYARRFAQIDVDCGRGRNVSAHSADGTRFRIAVDENAAWHALDRAVAETIGDPAHTALLGGDIDHLVAPESVLPRAWALLLGLSAQRVLCRFLRRLPGFSASHLDYAQRNLLEFTAHVDAQEERIVVRLGRPPLGLILNLAGCNRGDRRWPSLDPRPFVLFPEG